MKKLLNVLLITLALNFLAAAGGVGWLYGTGHLDRERVNALGELLFPPPAPATQPAAPAERDPATQPTLKLEELLNKRAGFSAAEQVEFIQHTFDAQMAQLDRRARELGDLQTHIDQAAAQLQRDREGLKKSQEQVAADKDEAQRLLTDKGFQDSLARYTAMPAKQVKTIFLALDDKTLVQYLQAMEPRTAAKVMKEFKTDAEVERMHKVLEKMRQPQASGKE